MKIGITYSFKQKYLPNKRYKNPRSRVLVTVEDIEIPEVKDEEFPVAFIVHDYKSRDNDYKLCHDEIRAYNGKLYKIWRVASGKGCGDIIPLENLYNHIKWRVDDEYAFDVPEKEMYQDGVSVIVSDNKQGHIDQIHSVANGFVIDSRGTVWEEAGEPMYHILTFGLGHNHGGTGFFIDEHYNPNCSAENYFNALQYEEARKYFNETAMGRGDTESVDNNAEDYIEVLMP